MAMTVKLFENTRSQAVWLPKECCFDGDAVVAHKIVDIVILMPQENRWDGPQNSSEMFSDDFMCDSREQTSIQEYENL